MTAPWLLDHAPYTPFMQDRTARPPGLGPLREADWIAHHPDHAAQMAYRAQLIAGKPDLVMGLLPEGAAPVRELMERLCAHLGVEKPAQSDLLRAIGHLVTEDFCLLLADKASGEYRLVAAVLCFPSRWLLSEKLGRPLTAIHDPVPDYDGTMARRVNRVFETLREGRALFRINWLVHATPDLHLPATEEAKMEDVPKTDGPFYLRCEHQTLVRLPTTGAVAFGIRTTMTPVEKLTTAEAQSLHDAMGRLEPAVVAYRAGSDLITNAMAELHRIACGSAQ